MVAVTSRTLAGKASVAVNGWSATLWFVIQPPKQTVSPERLARPAFGVVRVVVGVVAVVLASWAKKDTKINFKFQRFLILSVNPDHVYWQRPKCQFGNPLFSAKGSAVQYRWWFQIESLFTWGVPRVCGWSSWLSCTWTIKQKNVEIKKVVDKASVIFSLNRDAQNILIIQMGEKGWKQVALMLGSYCFQLNKCLTWQLFKFQGFLISSLNLDDVCWWRPQCQFENHFMPLAKGCVRRFKPH